MTDMQKDGIRFELEVMRPFSDVAMRRTREGRIRLRADVAVSPQFYGWLAGLGDRIKIISPEHVKDAYRQWLQNIIRSLE